MNNGLSQAEIDALLKDDESPGTDAAAPVPAAAPDGAAEADSGGTAAPAPAESPEPATAVENPEDAAPAETAETAAPALDYLTGVEIDAMGEIGNISMGTSATTLFALLGRRVDITTPRVTVSTMGEIARIYPIPFVAVEVSYTDGLKGKNVLFLREKDVMIITDLMMGGDGTDLPDELNDMHLSCISEVMNQMVGASSTSLSKILGHPIDISPPTSSRVDLSSPLVYPIWDSETPVVRTSFDMEVEGLINSEIMQVTPVDFAKEMVENLMGISMAAETAPAPAVPSAQNAPKAAAAPAAPPPFAAPQPAPAAPQGYAPPQGYYPPPGQPYPPPPAYGYGRPPVDVRAMQYGSFDDGSTSEVFGENMDLIMDVPLSVSVELGKSRKHIREILDFNVGTIVVLDKMAGELVDVVVNGKLIAKGEVVVIDDSYGCRITDIISPSKRINPPK